MNLDDQLRQRLQSSYSTWDPHAPDELPTPKRSHTPLIAGATVSTVGAAGLVAAVVLAGGAPAPAHRGPSGAQALDTSVRACTVDDARLVVSTDKPSYVQQPVDRAAQVEDRVVTVTAHLEATSTTPCRLFYEDYQSAYTGPGGQSTRGGSSCLFGEQRHNRTGPAPSAVSNAPWCAAEASRQAARPSPTETPTNPGEDDDYGLLLAVGGHDAGGAHQSEAADAAKGKLTPEPTYASVPVDDEGNGSRLESGVWTATVTYGPWSSSATFAVTPSS